jgi:hypothetical protein
VGDLRDVEDFKLRLGALAAYYQRQYGEEAEIDLAKEIAYYQQVRGTVLGMTTDTIAYSTIAFQEGREVAFLDIRVVDSDAPSYVDKPAMDVLKSHDEEKVPKYNDSCGAMAGSFTPFVISADGVLAPQAWKVIQTLAAQLTEKRNSLCNASLGETINWLRPRLQFASVRAASL